MSAADLPKVELARAVMMAALSGAPASARTL